MSTETMEKARHSFHQDLEQGFASYLEEKSGLKDSPGLITARKFGTVFGTGVLGLGLAATGVGLPFVLLASPLLAGVSYGGIRAVEGADRRLSSRVGKGYEWRSFLDSSQAKKIATKHMDTMVEQGIDRQQAYGVVRDDVERISYGRRDDLESVYQQQLLVREEKARIAEERELAKQPLWKPALGKGVFLAAFFGVPVGLGTAGLALLGAPGVGLMTALAAGGFTASLGGVVGSLFGLLDGLTRKYGPALEAEEKRKREREREMKQGSQVKQAQEIKQEQSLGVLDDGGARLDAAVARATAGAHVQGLRAQEQQEQSRGMGVS